MEHNDDSVPPDFMPLGLDVLPDRMWVRFNTRDHAENPYWRSFVGAYDPLSAGFHLSINIWRGGRYGAGTTLDVSAATALRDALSAYLDMVNGTASNAS